MRPKAIGEPPCCAHPRCLRDVGVKGGRWNKYCSIRCAASAIGSMKRDRAHLFKAHRVWSERRKWARRAALTRVLLDVQRDGISLERAITVIELREARAYQRGHSVGRKLRASRERAA